MLRNRIYYAVKPVLPRWFRTMLRGRRARRILKNCTGTWPIYEPGGRRPQGWPGWPDGKQFSFVLSHDVESVRGLKRCRQLAELEMQHGFRSSFNFIPEGDYRVPEELRGWLRGNGFEVGVHDLHHDGSLFRSRPSFERAAAAINRRLAEWGAAGFRAGFMLHKLDWLHSLNIEYDASTFDVDPFEPQADGVETIFPFWIPRPEIELGGPRESRAIDSGENHGGYIELPYTMVQDFNLFVVLQQRTTDLWSRKLDWIARKGGMALLNTHPDYMSFDDARPRADEYPVRLYADFLREVRRSCGDSAYCAVPLEVARYARRVRPVHARPPRQVCLVTYGSYESDGQVRGCAEAMSRRGDHVSVLSLAGETFPVGTGELNGVRVVRLCRPSARWRGPLDKGRFWWKAFRALQSHNFPDGCDLVQVHGMSDALVFAAACLKWRGAKVMLDRRNLFPELAQDNFRLSLWHLVRRPLRAMEALACCFAHHVIVSEHLAKKAASERLYSNAEISALINSVELPNFPGRARPRDKQKFIIVYLGLLHCHQGLDIAIDAMAQVREAVPTAELHIHGHGLEWQNLRDQAVRLGLNEAIVFHKPVGFSQIGEVMANADLGVVPERIDGTENGEFSNKIMEFMAQGLPVVASRAKTDRIYFTDDCVCFFDSLNASDLAAKIISLARDSARREQFARNALQMVRETSWEMADESYLAIVDQLTRTRLPVLKAAPMPSEVRA